MDVEALKKNLPPLDITQQYRSPEQQEYFRHYKLDFEDRYPGLQHFFGRIDSGEYRLACHYFRCEQARGSCFILHGYYDHAGLFNHLIDYCIQRQLSVVIFDLPGHGLSSGEQVSINDFSDYQAALNTVLERFEGELIDPWYALAQSTGGAILMDYLLDNPQSIFSKTVLLAPLVRPKGWAGAAVLGSLLKLVTRRFPRRPSNSSSDEGFKKFINENDPLQSPVLSVVWLTALRRWVARFLLHKPCEHAPLVVQGKKDSTVDWLYNIGIIRKKFPRAEICYMDNARHHLANETEQKRAKLYRLMDSYLAE